MFNGVSARKIMEFLQLIRREKAVTNGLNENTPKGYEKVARGTIIYGLNVRDCYVT